jgi:TolB protein
MKFITKIILPILVFATLNCSQSIAEVSLRIDNKAIPKIKILFNSTSQNNTKASADIDSILNRIQKNLRGTDLFDVIQKKDIDTISAGEVYNLYITKVPDFITYTNKGVGMILIVDANLAQSGDLEVKVRLWDALDERQLFGKFYASDTSNYKKIASLISDEIFKVAIGEKIGYFDSKITYIAESGRATKRIKRIAMIDFDGENLRYLTDGRDLVLTPVFLKQKSEILFVRFFGEKPQIYSLNINDAFVRKVSSFRGTTFAPTVNPKDNNIIAFSTIENGNSNIYQMNLFSNQTTRLTNTRSIDTTPSYSPDGQYIVFSSDRTGSEQIYIMNQEGRDLRKITSNDGSYSKPMWSPDGKFIAFTKMKAGQFSIGITNIDGKNEKIITSGYLVEGAKWSPNSRYLLYSKKTGAYGKASIPKLYIVDILTGFERQIITPKNEGATDPDWIAN